MKSLAFFFVLMVPAFGRIGETPEELKARYGEPVAVDSKTDFMAFQKAGFMIHCKFHKGTAGMVFMFKEKKPGTFQLSNPKISAAEIETLLKANGADGEWADVTAQFELVNKLWQNKKAKRRAIHNTVENTFSVITDELMAFSAEKTKNEEKAALEDF